MKLKKNYILKQIANQTVLIPVSDEALKFNGMVSLNETSAFLCECLKEEMTLDALAVKLTESYNIDLEKAKKDIVKFTTMLKDKGILE